MTIPTTSVFPDGFDTDTNLFLVHDGLRVTLAEDYNPGDTTIHVLLDWYSTASSTMLSAFPPTGILTLTEQCSDIDKRALTFFYNQIDTSQGTISGLELFPGFTDCIKPKNITHATINVVDLHHNNLKEALVAIQNWAGVKGTCDTMPFGPTLEGRINFLRKVVLVPRAWFSVDKTMGIAPLEVEFTDRSFRLGTDGTAGPVLITWDFGDQTTSVISLVNATDSVPGDAINVIVRDTDGGTIRKTYHRPGIYTVKMKVQNDFGEDELVYDELIHVRAKAPNEAIITFVGNTANQVVTVGDPPTGPFTTYPKIRSPVNTLIQLLVQDGENYAQPGYSYAGEALSEQGVPLDPINLWTWAAADDLVHPSAPDANLSFGIGGIYDLKLRVDTVTHAFRITTYPGSLDIVEKNNMWLWTTDDPVIQSYEYGLISETFKLGQSANYIAERNNSFLDDVPDVAHQKQEFRKNVAFNPRSTLGSGDLASTAMLYWASGRSAEDDPALETIVLTDFNGFLGTYQAVDPISRGWNWFHLPASGASYFYGGEFLGDILPGISPVNKVLNKVTLGSAMYVSATSLADEDYLNGALDLTSNPAVFDDQGDSTYGHYSVYRSAWKDNTGYVLKNDAPGLFFRIKSFYRTNGTIAEPVQRFEKMEDIQGSMKLEGELVALAGGIYFFNNSGSVSAFDPTTTIWKEGGPGLNSAIYRDLQDTTVEGYADETNTLFACSNGNRKAFLSFDYSTAAFMKFNELDTTFTALGTRPDGLQFMVGFF